MTNQYGTVIFSNEIKEKTLNEVRAAARFAEIDESFVHAIKPRNSFIRSIRELKKRNVIEEQNCSEVLLHKFGDSVESIQFQFSRCYQEQNGVNYDRAAVVTFDKLTHRIECQNYDLLKLARDLYDESMGKYTVTDLNALVKRVIEKRGAKRLLLRDGVYFVPVQFSHVVEQVRNFFSQLNIAFFQLSVGDDSGQKGNILKAAVADIRKTVDSYQAEVTKLKASGDLTPRIAKNRLQELKDELDRYKGIATALRTDLSSILGDAQDAGETLFQCGVDDIDTLISSVQRGGLASPLVCDLVSAFELPVAAEVSERDVLAVDIAE